MIRFNRFTKSAQDVAQRAAELMQRYSHNQIDTEHLLFALIEQPQGVISQLLAFLEVDANALSEGLDNNLRSGPKGDIVDVGPGQIAITQRVRRIIDLGIEEANLLNDELISDEHLFLAIFSEHNTPAVRLLEGAGLTRDRIYDAIQQIRR